MGVRAPVRLVGLALGDARERVLRLGGELRVASAGGVIVRVCQVCTARRSSGGLGLWWPAPVRRRVSPAKQGSRAAIMQACKR